MSKWIRTADALPSPLTEVLIVIVHDSGPDVDVGLLLPNGEWAYAGMIHLIGDPISHWMPFPELPQ